MNLFSCMTLSVEVWGVKEILSPFPCSPVIRECLWKITQIEEKKALSVQNLHSAKNEMEASQTLVTYAQAFATAIKESMKSATKWSVHYFTSREKWYPSLELPVPLNALKFSK